MYNDVLCCRVCLHCQDDVKKWNETSVEYCVWLHHEKSHGKKNSIKPHNLQFMSKTKLVSFGSTSFVLSAWHVNIEFKSARWTDGQSRRFSITSPELCSVWSSTCNPFISQRTSGDGRPVNELKRKIPFLLSFWEILEKVRKNVNSTTLLVVNLFAFLTLFFHIFSSISQYKHTS